MAGGHHCCCDSETTCDIAEDDFSRTWEASGYAEPGAAWSEEAGDWICEQASESLLTFDTDAYIRFETPHPDAVAEHSVMLYLPINASVNQPGDKLRIVLCDTLFAELEFGIQSLYGSSVPVGCFIIRLFNGTTLLQESGRFPLRVNNYVHLSHFRAGYSATTGVLWAAALASNATADGSPVCLSHNVGTVTGTKVGIGTGDTNGSGVAVDHFYYRHHNYGTTVEKCDGPCLQSEPNCTIAQFPYGGGAFANRLVLPSGETFTPSTGVGCGWNLSSGTWDSGGAEFAGGAARWLETSDSDALIETLEQSEFTCSQYDPPGYHRVDARLEGGAAGDQFRIVLDWDGTSGHEVIVTLGSYAVENSGSIAIYRDGTLLESIAANIHNDWVASAQAYLLFSACIFQADDESGFTSIKAGVTMQWYVAGSGWQELAESLVSITTVMGGTRAGFGSGDTVNTLRFTSFVVNSNYQECQTCSGRECNYCPGGDSMDNGLAVGVAGLAAKYGDLCNCADINATYLAAYYWWANSGDCAGWASEPICTVGEGLGAVHERVRVGWEIQRVPVDTGVAQTGWKLTLDLILVKSVWPWGDIVEGGWRFAKTFSMSDRCDQLSGVTLDYVELIEPSAPDGYPISYFTPPCDATGLTITVSSY